MTERTVWVGAYTTLSETPSAGITAMTRLADGGLEVVGTAVEAPDPSYLLRDPRRRDIVYAVDEGGRGVQSFRRTSEHRLEPIGWVATNGDYPCHLGFRESRAGAFLDVSCYGDGGVVVHPVDDDGRIGEPVQTLAGTGSGPHAEQDGPHAHSTLRVDGLVLSADLGSDDVHVHEVRSDGMLDRVDSLRLPAGTGPRDLIRHPSGAVWVLGEHGKTVTVLVPIARGFRLGETVPLAPHAQLGDVAADQAAALSVSADGTRAFAGLRGSNRIAVLAADLDDASPHPVGTFDAAVEWPRHHLLEVDIVHVAGERSNTVVSLRLDPLTDGAALIGAPVPVAAPTFLLPA
ncbi:beta-propeller fold lactonase family protein [Herbiconiux sp. L3-i23]|uniref:lactonase family protein n=1 Tax=Herbiconiux sp. L3-i23 TaxID=2905871 RepID=UPI002053F10C|nr:beta-propeller fold lactonase family protein [Herbiconiux sp. L3-i23]BDI23025.1 hypothetical protein L3i23_18010 [Herbiconiux sp. L3-i23]